MKFSSLKLSPESLSVLAELGFDTMTAVQGKTIPLIMAGKDVLAQSRTGSGKTAAFSLPLLEKLDLENRDVQALVLCPTRELCAQVAREIRRLGRRRPALQVLVASGGQPLAPQRDALYRGAHLVVGTPGRVADLIQRNAFPMESFQTLVLDEADRMLEMGFEEEMNMILAALPEKRQSVFFSATYPANIREMSRRSQKSPVEVIIPDEGGNAAADIEQLYLEAENDEKARLLARYLRRADPDSALIFCSLKATTRDLAEFLRKEFMSAEALNGDLEQEERDQVLAKFRNGSIRYLIATDVAARGLDIKELPLVINYELPRETETYIHRIGRTGRAGQKGQAVAFVSAAEQSRLIEVQLSTGVTLIRSELPPRSEQSSGPRPASMRTLMISAGRKNKIRPGDLLGALTGEGGQLNAKDVGKIEIHDHISFVAVTSALAESVLKKLSQGRIKGQRYFVKLLS